MKKAIVLSAVLLTAVAQAEFMKWTVEDDQFNTVEGLAGQVTYMRVGYVTANGQQPCWQGQTLTAYDMSGQSTGGSDVGYVDGAEFQVDLSGVKVDTYAFYIELLNSSHQVIGRSGNESTHTYTTYSDLSKGGYVATGDIGAVPAANVWQGGGSFTACPEPSSMALLALGAGLVGLRRRLKRGKRTKKGKRA